MIYSNDLQELGMHSIEHYYKEIINQELEACHSIAEQMIRQLSKKQKLDLLDFVDKHTEINASIDIIECAAIIEEITMRWI